MAPRTELQERLETITDRVYFQPPQNVDLTYPCIVYARSSSLAEHSGNLPYRISKQYQVTVITRDPDSDLPDKVEELAMCRFDRFYPADNLNHYVFSLFF